MKGSVSILSPQTHYYDAFHGVSQSLHGTHGTTC